ncbi:alginate export family protein [Denitrobaculum tricleocarpae]|uniref:Alginate export family protein n=1 Tax=Denitrobaculum tricleocarpae TaxID=2591009 RepID=A0A545TN08_9PROT|nr:alginate export family protein [Denitrobaculum tricleocarpae]TQV78615.1 alginate export family protein [Denitrobaculum tricleocarpae]
MRQSVITAAALLLAWPINAAAEPRPELQKFRFHEDYRFLRTFSGAPDPFDPIKYVPLDDSGSSSLSFGGSIRERYEYTGNPLFGDDPQDEDGVWLQRANLHGDLYIGRNLRFFGEFSSALSEGRAGGPSPVDENELDVQNAFADISFPVDRVNSFTLRAGRQELQFGTGRLVDVREGANVRRTFDGVRGLVEVANWDLDLLAVRPRRDENGIFDDRTNRDEVLWGVYAAGEPQLLAASGLDLYYLGFRDDRGSFVQAVEDETRHSIGARLSGNRQGWDWNLEAAYQFGTFGDGDIAAWTAASDTGFKFDETLFQPRIGLRANIASGDEDPADDELQTFNPLYPRGNYFSQAAVLGPRNFFNLNPHLNFQITEEFALNTDANFYWRLEKKDGVYSPSGQIIRGPGQSDARYVATGVSVEATWAPLRNVDFTAIYTHLAPGAFIEETGASESVDFIELTARFRF